eukprot:TRINITY_DN4431_c0_g2_i2.p1 TRINITY_DN4431_c0_g2~~TRINITY_DN4431_c0_g2_i2.p1  ORF type:complete len:299 (-),score=68.52 TRINITY_DN4431_c0_g2_i2:58-954(-)
MIRRPPRSTLSSSSAASDVYKRQYQRRVREHTSKAMMETTEDPEEPIMVEVEDAGSTVPALLRDPVLVPYGVLGTQMLEGGYMEQRAGPPKDDVAFVDPAGLTYIQHGGGPSQAGGASGAIYDYLGIGHDDEFAPAVVAAVKKDGDAKFMSYGDKHCVHVVGPNFNDNWARDQDYAWAVHALSEAYEHVLHEFAGSANPTLRLLPISGSIFAGKWKSRVHELTVDAWRLAITRLPMEHTATLSARRLEMCVFEEEELPLFLAAFQIAFPDESTCFKTCLLYTSPSPRDRTRSRMPSSA